MRRTVFAYIGDRAIGDAMMGTDNRRIIAGWWLTGLALLLSACTPPIRSFGTLADPRDDRTFTMEAGPAADVNAAVGNALLAAGYRPSANAHYSVEAGLAVRSPRISVMTATADGKTMQPLAPVSNPSGLCRQRSYVLSIALIERTSGRVVARGGAVASRCGKADDASLLPSLAKAALGDINAS